MILLRSSPFLVALLASAEVAIVRPPQELSSSLLNLTSLIFDNSKNTSEALGTLFPSLSSAVDGNLLNTSSAALSPFPDPYVLPVSGSRTTVVFYDHHDHLDRLSAKQIWTALNKESFAHHKGGLDVPIGTHERVYVSTDGKARLILRPLEMMTWWNLWALALGLKIFCEGGGGHVQFRFHVVDQGWGERGLWGLESCVLLDVG